MYTRYPAWWKIKTPFEKIVTIIDYILLFGVAIANGRHLLPERLGMGLLVLVCIPITITSSMAYFREGSKEFGIFFAVLSLAALIVGISAIFFS